jgi:hypothetical protein
VFRPGGSLGAGPVETSATDETINHREGDLAGRSGK